MKSKQTHPISNIRMTTNSRPKRARLSKLAHQWASTSPPQLSRSRNPRRNSLTERVKKQATSPGPTPSTTHPSYSTQTLQTTNSTTGKTRRLRMRLLSSTSQGRRRLVASTEAPQFQMRTRSRRTQTALWSNRISQSLMRLMRALMNERENLGEKKFRGKNKW